MTAFAVVRVRMKHHFWIDMTIIIWRFFLFVMLNLFQYPAKRFRIYSNDYLKGVQII